MSKMATRRVYFSGVILGVSLATAVWLLTYRVWDVVEYIDRDGHHFHLSERVKVQPWWSVPATVALMLVGIGITSGSCQGGAAQSGGWLIISRTSRITSNRGAQSSASCRANETSACVECETHRTSFQRVPDDLVSRAELEQLVAAGSRSGAISRNSPAAGFESWTIGAPCFALLHDVTKNSCQWK